MARCVTVCSYTVNQCHNAFDPSIMTLLGTGGEIGHIKVKNSEIRSCGCGKRGCLEQYTSATGLVNAAKELLTDDTIETELRKIMPLTCKAIFDCAKAGDTVANRLVDDMAEILGNAMEAISCVCDPEIIVIGGGVAKAGKILLDKIQEQFKQRAFSACEETRFALATLGNDAGIYGSVQMIIGR